MEPMDVEEGSDVIGADGKDDRTSASPPSPPEVSSAAMASEAMEGLEASAGQDDHGDPHGERVASVEAKPGPSQQRPIPARTPLTRRRRGLPRPQRPFELLHQTRKVSALDFPITLAHDPHIVVISVTS